MNTQEVIELIERQALMYPNHAENIIQRLVWLDEAYFQMQRERDKLFRNKIDALTLLDASRRQHADTRSQLSEARQKMVKAQGEARDRQNIMDRVVGILRCDENAESKVELALGIVDETGVGSLNDDES